MTIRLSISALALLLASAALAHQGVTNPAVLARMNGMSTIAEEMEVLGRMAKGAAPFDAPAARQALRAIAAEAEEIPALFAAPETDPKSEALPEIWTQYDDFTVKARALTTLAEDLAQTVSMSEDLPAAMRQLGDNCSACHKPYRK
ncbi:MAG: cytochrome c [Pseudomonadota bacterium]